MRFAPLALTLAVVLTGCMSTASPSGSSSPGSLSGFVDCDGLRSIIAAGQASPDFASIRTDQQVEASGFFNNYAVTAEVAGADRVYLQQQFDRDDSSRRFAVVVAEQSTTGNAGAARVLIPTDLSLCLGDSWTPEDIDNGKEYSDGGDVTLAYYVLSQNDGATLVRFSVFGPEYRD